VAGYYWKDGFSPHIVAFDVTLPTDALKKTQIKFRARRCETRNNMKFRQQLRNRNFVKNILTKFAKTALVFALPIIMVLGMPTFSIGSHTMDSQQYQSRSTQLTSNHAATTRVIPAAGANAMQVTTIYTNAAPGSTIYNEHNGCVYVLTPLPSVQVISGASNTIIGTINLGATTQPAQLVYDRDNFNIYISDYATNDISVITTSGTTCTTDNIGSLSTTTISVAPNTGPGNIVYDSYNQNLYVENELSSTVCVIHLTPTTGTLLTSFAVTMSGGWSHPMWYDIAGTDSLGHLTLDGSNAHVFISPIDAFNRIGQVIDVISTNSMTVVSQLISGQDPFYAVYDPANNNMYFDNSNNNPHSVSAITPTLTISSFSVGAEPSNPGILAYDAKNGFIYDANSGSGDVAVIDPANTSTLPTLLHLGDIAGSVAYNLVDGNMYFGTKSFTTPHVLIYNSPAVTTGSTLLATINIGGNGSSECAFVTNPMYPQWVYVVNCAVWYPGPTQNFVAVLSDADFTTSTSDSIALSMGNTVGCGIVHVTFTSVPTWSGTVKITTDPNPNSNGPVYAGFYDQGYVYKSSVDLGSGSSVTLPLVIWAASWTTGTYTVTVKASDGSINGGPSQQIVVTVTFTSGYFNNCSSRSIT